MSRLLEALRSGRVLLMDGAMGTELQRAGLPAGACPERWNLTHPERVGAIHQAYVKAGARCLLTNTFQANPEALAEHGLRHQLAPINRAALDVALEAARLDVFVLAAIGPLPDPLERGQYLHPEAIVEMVSLLSPADALLLETQTNPLGMVAAWICRAAFRPCEVPVFLSFTFRKARGKLCTNTGHRPEVCAARAHQFGIGALGVNCGREIGMDDTIEIIRRYRQITDLPLFARPNAGTPTRVGGRWVYPQTPQRMAERIPELLEAGVAMLGGCCGTTPAHIAAFRPIVEAWNVRRGFTGINP